MTDNTLREKFSTTSQRYGNDKTLDEVFEREKYPTSGELQKELADTALLTEKEAFAFVQGRFEGYPPVSGEMADEMVQSQGFKNISEFNAKQQTAMEKVADAIWIYELIDAYRFPDFSNLPDECTECGCTLGNTWVEPEGSSGSFCRDCADIDAEHFNQL